MTKLLGLNMHPLWLGDGRAEDFLNPLKELGLNVLEFTLNLSSPDWPEMRSLIEECHRLGFRLTFHAPYKWDLGHDARNGSAPVPPGFITSVSHVHLHDISPVASISFSINTSVPSPCSQ